MSIYMDKPPTTCECCPCNDDSYRCGATGETFKSMWYTGRLASCPIKPLADVVERSSYESMEHTVAKLNEALSNSVEVVRCKDCKWYHGIGCAIEISDESDAPTDNDYCSFGERAEE